MDSGQYSEKNLFHGDGYRIVDDLKKNTWFPLLSPKCTVMFRCTNLQHTLRYRDGSVTGLGWDNQRGVIRAIEEYLGTKVDEEREFDRILGDWDVHHVPWGAGLTIMRRKGERS
ncbi:MAG: hypothetical protein M0R06_01585 [Sphaerochaeta sp.]|nr:hypothetical protein [Sphaerochaeta sp.]